MKNISLNFLIIILLVVIYFLIITSFDIYKKELKEEEREVVFETYECEKSENFINYYYFEEENNSLIVYIMVNCCSEEIKIAKENGFYVIKEIDKDNLLCRCLCNKKIVIRNAEKLKIKFIDYNNNEIIIEEFCGISKYSFCNSDKDCVVSGCSSEICANQTYTSICIWKDCYRNLINYRCACINNKCQWIKIK